MNRPPPSSTLFPTTPLFRSPLRPLHPRPAPAREHVGGGAVALDRATVRPLPAVRRERVVRRTRRRRPRSAALGSLARSEEHTSELQSRQYLVCRLLLEKIKF